MYSMRRQTEYDHNGSDRYERCGVAHRRSLGSISDLVSDNHKLSDLKNARLTDEYFRPSPPVELITAPDTTSIGKLERSVGYQCHAPNSSFFGDRDVVKIDS